MRKKLKLKGLYVPRIFIWILGFIHGCISRTAVVDQESGLISSGYITEKIRLFNKLSSDYVKTMEDELKALRNEAAGLLADEAILRKEAEEIAIPEALDTVEKRRAARSAGLEMSACRDKYRKVLARLIEIGEKINSRELIAQEELDATASALQALFAVYGRGMLIRPLRSTMIPPVEYEKSFEMYYRAHAKDTLQLEQVLEEVYGNARKDGLSFK